MFNNDVADIQATLKNIGVEAPFIYRVQLSYIRD